MEGKANNDHTKNMNNEEVEEGQVEVNSASRGDGGVTERKRKAKAKVWKRRFVNI